MTHGRKTLGVRQITLDPLLRKLRHSPSNGKSNAKSRIWSVFRGPVFRIISQSYKEAGLSYLRYLSIVTRAMHAVQKDGPLLTKNIRFSTVGYKAFVMDHGVTKEYEGIALSWVSTVAARRRSCM